MRALRTGSKIRAGGTDLPHGGIKRIAERCLDLAFVQHKGDVGDAFDRIAAVVPWFCIQERRDATDRCREIGKLPVRYGGDSGRVLTGGRAEAADNGTRRICRHRWSPLLREPTATPKHTGRQQAIKADSIQHTTGCGFFPQLPTGLSHRRNGAVAVCESRRESPVTHPHNAGSGG